MVKKKEDFIKSTKTKINFKILTGLWHFFCQNTVSLIRFDYVWWVVQMWLRGNVSHLCYCYEKNRLLYFRFFFGIVIRLILSSPDYSWILLENALSPFIALFILTKFGLTSVITGSRGELWMTSFISHPISKLIIF